MCVNVFFFFYCKKKEVATPPANALIFALSSQSKYIILCKNDVSHLLKKHRCWKMQHFAVGNSSLLYMSPWSFFTFTSCLELINSLVVVSICHSSNVLSVLYIKPFVMSWRAKRTTPGIPWDTLPFYVPPQKNVWGCCQSISLERRLQTKGWRFSLVVTLSISLFILNPSFFLNLLAVLPYWFPSEQSIDPVGISPYLMMQPVSRGHAGAVRSICRLSLCEVGEARPKRFIPLQAGRIDSSSACVNQTLYAALCCNNGTVISQVLLPNARGLQHPKHDITGEWRPGTRRGRHLLMLSLAPFHKLNCQ